MQFERIVDSNFFHLSLRLSYVNENILKMSLTLATLWQSHSATLGGERSLLLVLSTRLKKQSRIRMAVHFLFPRFFKGEWLTGDMLQDVDQRLIFKVNVPLHLYKTKNAACIPACKWMTAIFAWMSCLLKQKSCYWLWKLDIEKFIFEGLEKRYGRELSQEVGILYKILCRYASYPIVCMQGWTNNCFKMEKFLSQWSVHLAVVFAHQIILW